MSADAIKQMLSSIVPFIRTVGLSIDEVGAGTAIASLENRQAVQNHLGSVHAGALYTAGESASGAVVLSIFVDLLPAGAFIALKSATVAHTKARVGDLIATATLDGDPAAIRRTFDEAGKVDFDVEAVSSVEGTEVARITYTWAARVPRS